MVKDILDEAVKRLASDVHLTVGVPPILRIDGQLTRTERPKLSVQDTEAMLKEFVPPEQYERFREHGDIDFSYSIPGVSRFRVNAFRQRGSTAVAIRIVNEIMPTIDALGLPKVLETLARQPRGLVLVTGPTGSGKSTTQAAMINLINSERSCHIVTLEDPIEYLHRHNRSIINQREINSDSLSFGTALRAVLREDPDVILVGEMRDAETMATAITAAETGHLVLATLHTGSAAQTVDRVIDSFPPYQQQQIRVQMSITLQGVVAQQLLPRREGSGRVAAMEIMIATPAVRNIIREGQTHQLLSVLQTGAKFGMQTMDMALCDLYRAGTVAYDEAAARAWDLDTFKRLVHAE